MKVRAACIGIFCLIVCHCTLSPAKFSSSRDLPAFYIPGEPMTYVVTITEWVEEGYWPDPGWYVPFEGSLEGDMYETIPEGWSCVGSNYDVTFDEETHTVHWMFGLTRISPTGGGGWWPKPYYHEWTVRCDVLPPVTQRGEVQFTGRYVDRWGGSTVDPAGTTGDFTVSERVGRVVYRPYWATIQATIDSCEWGDTIMVSGKDTPYVETVTMKPGVNLAGFVEWPSYEPAVLRSAVAELPAVIAAPGARLSGFIISSCPCGVQVDGPDFEVSDCLITGTQTAAVEFLEGSSGRVVNCTIVNNSGAGVVCHQPSPDVVVSNSIVLGNGGKDVDGCTSRFCLLEDEVDEGRGKDNISGDPLFVNQAEGDYRLLRGSPCIDAGSNAERSHEGTDLLGRPRFMFAKESETVDLGAYEYWFVSVSRHPVTGKVQVSWASKADKSYSVFFSDDQTVWQAAQGNVLGSGMIAIWVDPIGWPPWVKRRFYRVMESE